MPIPSPARSSTQRQKPARATAGNVNDWSDALHNIPASGRTEISLAKAHVIYSQGQAADAVYFVRQGKVRLSVVSKVGKEAILGMLTAGDFFGEGCLAGQPRRVGSATAMTAVDLIQVRKASLVQALHDQHPLSEAFLTQLLARNIAFEEDICDQLFNHSEKRLARALLKLARFGQDPVDAKGHTIAPRVSQEALAEMIGTTRSRVNFFMNKFRRLGLIEYNGEFRVHPELLTDVVLSD